MKKLLICKMSRLGSEDLRVHKTRQSPKWTMAIGVNHVTYRRHTVTGLHVGLYPLQKSGGGGLGLGEGGLRPGDWAPPGLGAGSAPRPTNCWVHLDAGHHTELPFPLLGCTGHVCHTFPSQLSGGVWPPPSPLLRGPIVLPDDNLWPLRWQ